MPPLRDFEVLFDRSEQGSLDDPAYRRYGRALGFPPPPPDRPWIFSNFVQSVDGIASFLGRHASGGDISRSPEDRWLMDLLRAHADAVLLGINTLVEETALGGDRGPVYRVADTALRDLRNRLGRKREINAFVTGAATVKLGDYAVFDGREVDTIIVTTTEGSPRLRQLGIHLDVQLVVAGQGGFVDLPLAMHALRQKFGIEYLLCEGGPTLNGYMTRAGLIDERFLTVSPLEVGALVPRDQEPARFEKEHPPTHRPTTFNAPGFLFEDAPQWEWLSCRRISNHQFNRYRRMARS